MVAIMKKQRFIMLVAFAASLAGLQSCSRSSNDVWEDTKSAGRHVGRGVNALCGGGQPSRQIRSRGDFECIDDCGYYEETGVQDCNMQGGYANAQDYVPMQDQCNDIAMADMVSIQPRETPGEAGSSIPGISAFRDPSTNPALANIFNIIYFDYDSSLVKGQQNLQTVHRIADYMRRHPNLYVFIEGHTDERGPQAYNLALGSRRSNAVRNLLISEGVNPDNLFTISYGKERPVVMERHEEGFSKNRRAEFKTYER